MKLSNLSRSSEFGKISFGSRAESSYLLRCWMIQRDVDRCFVVGRLSTLFESSLFWKRKTSRMQRRLLKRVLIEKTCVTAVDVAHFLLLPQLEWNTNGRFKWTSILAGLTKPPKRKLVGYVKPKIEQPRRSWKSESIKHPTTCLDVWKFVQFGFRSRLRTFSTDSVCDFISLDFPVKHHREWPHLILEGEEKQIKKWKISIFNCEKHFLCCALTVKIV